MLSEQRPPKAKILTKSGSHDTQHFKGLSSLGNPIAKGPSFPYTHFKKLEQGWAGRELTFPKGAERGGCPLTRRQPLWEWTGYDFGRICCSLSFQSYSHSKTKIPRTWCKQGQTPAWPFPGRYRRLRKTYLGASRRRLCCVVLPVPSHPVLATCCWGGSTDWLPQTCSA